MIRHTPRQSERDLRLHEPHSVPLAPPQVPQPPPPHLNGNGVIPAAATAIPNGPLHGHVPSISPKVASTVASNGVSVPPSIQKLADANEQTWLVIGNVAEQMGDLEHALSAYENALRHNPMSVPGLTQVAGIARVKENFPMAVEYFQRVIHLQQDNGEIWSALGHCYLMQDDLQKAYSAYQQALYSLPNPKENPKLWYGIGILYDRYGSLDNAEEAFSSVLRMDKDFDKSNEVLFRLGIIYKQQSKYDDSLRCFDRILRNPPSPLANADIWFQIGHVYEQQGDHVRARDAYERVVAENPVHAKVLQQLGWLFHQDGTPFQNQDVAIHHLTKSLEADPADAQSWYLLGRAYMAGQKYNKAYEAYQQAVYRDGRNPTFWCSIGVLYFQINQFRDALDAYSRAIRINPYIPEVWFDLGSLYESCNNQISDAIDAYARAAELDPQNVSVTSRLQLLKHSQATGAQLPAAPPPQDVHPTAYASAVVPPPGLGTPSLLLHSGVSARPMFRADSRGPGEHSLPPPPQIAPRGSPAPFRGGPPPPVVLDESRQGPSHTPLAPMDVDHIPATREPGSSYPSAPGRHINMLLHHPGPSHEPDSARNAPSHHDSYYPRHPHAPSIPGSPSPHSRRPHSPGASPYQRYHPGERLPVGPGQSETHSRSPRAYGREMSTRPVDRDPRDIRDSRDAAWERREWEHEHERRGRPGSEYPAHSTSYYPPRPVSPVHPAISPRMREREASPVSAHPSGGRAYWDMRSGPPSHTQPSSPQRPPAAALSRRPEPMQIDREIVPEHRGNSRMYEASPDAARGANRNVPPPFVGSNVRGSESPHGQRGSVAPEQKDRRRRSVKEKEAERPMTGPGSTPVAEPPKRRRRAGTKRTKDDRGRTETPNPYGGERPPQQALPFKVVYTNKANDSPEPVSSHGSGSTSRSAQQSPTSATTMPPARVVDEDYDEGVADALINLSSYRAPEQQVPYTGGTSGPAMPPGGPRPTSPTPSLASHRGSISSTRSRNTPPDRGSSGSMKRPLSPGPEEGDAKRSKMEAPKHRASSASPPSRPSPVPFRGQPSSRSPENRQIEKAKHPSYPSSPQLPSVLPPHPRPIGAGLSHPGNVALPPIATLSPTSSAPSPARETERTTHSRSPSHSPPAQPPSRNKLSDVMNPAAGSPVSKMAPMSASSAGSIDKSEHS